MAQRPRKRKSPIQSDAVTPKQVAELDAAEGLVQAVEWGEEPKDEPAADNAAAIEDSALAHDVVAGEVDESPAEAAIEAAPSTDAEDDGVATPESETVQDDLPPQTEDVAQAASPPSDDDFPDFLLRASALTKEQAKAQFGNAAALEQAVHYWDAQLAQAGRQWLDQQQQQLSAQTQVPAQQVQQPQIQQRAQPPAQPTAAEPTASEYQMPVPSHGGAWDEDATRLIHSVRDYSDQQVRRMESQLAQQRAIIDQMRADREAASAREYVGQVDAFIDRLGPKWAPLLGSGSGYSLAPESPQLLNRKRLSAIADGMAAGFHKNGLPTPALTELLARATYVAFPEQTARQVKQDVVQQLAARKQQITSRPGSTKPSQVTGRARALAREREFFHKLGVSEDEFDASVL